MASDEGGQLTREEPGPRGRCQAWLGVLHVEMISIVFSYCWQVDSWWCRCERMLVTTTPLEALIRLQPQPETNLDY